MDAARLQALLRELAANPAGVSTARLCKRLDLRMSVLLRTLAWIGEEPIAGAAAPGWVRLREDGARTLVLLTGSGRAVVDSLRGSSAPGGHEVANASSQGACSDGTRPDGVDPDGIASPWAPWHRHAPAARPARAHVRSSPARLLPPERMSRDPAGFALPSRRPLVLVVDDDEDIAALIGRYLGGHGFDVDAAHSGAGMQSALADREPDVVLLDLGLPDADGLTLLQQLRTRWQGPVIVVSGRGEAAVERVIGLELGADDYVAKPFDFRELLARIRSVLRRAAPAGGEPASAPRRRLAFAHLVLDPASRRLHREDGTEIPLTTGEFELLRALLDRPNEVRTRDELMTALHGREAGPFDRAIDVAVARLRRKVEADPASPDLIRSVRGAGYLLAAEVRPA